MKRKLIKTLIYSSALALMSGTVSAESLFHLNTAESVYQVQPKSLFSTIRAKTIGDIITVIINENASVTSEDTLNIKSGASMEDKFTSVINDLFTNSQKGRRLDIPSLDGYGGSTQTKNSASVSKSVNVKDTITTQVVEVLPNGNLVIQGKKVAINSGEKTQIIISGIVDPRFITNTGTVDSQNIANLQLAVVGNGTVSRYDGESLISRIFSHMF